VTIKGKQLLQSVVFFCIATAFVLCSPAMLSGDPTPQADLRIDSIPGATLDAGNGATAENVLIQEIERYTSITAAQKKRMEEMVDAFDKRERDHEETNRVKHIAIIRALQAAIAAHDDSAAAKAREELAESDQPIASAFETLRTDLQNVLTSTQRKDFRDGKQEWMINRIAAPVQLGDAQMARAMAAYPQPDKVPNGVGFEEKVARVVVGVMTPEQKTQVVKHYATEYVTNVFGRAALTQEQMKTVAGIVAELANDRRFDGDWPLHTGMKKALRARVNPLLTPEQRRAVESAK